MSTNSLSPIQKLLVPDIMLTAATPLSATSTAFKASTVTSERRIQDPDRLQVPRFERKRTTSHTVLKDQKRPESLKRSASSPMLSMAGQDPRQAKPPKSVRPEKKHNSSDISNKFSAKAPWSTQGMGPARLDFSFWRPDSIASKGSEHEIVSNLHISSPVILKEEVPKPHSSRVNSIGSVPTPLPAYAQAQMFPREKSWQYDIPTVLVDIQPKIVSRWDG
jgi:hypothetical protein